MINISINDYLFKMSNDLSEDISLVLPHDKVENWPDNYVVRIPFAVMAELVGQIIKRKSIEDLEEESGLEYLGIHMHSDDDDWDDDDDGWFSDDEEDEEDE